MSGAGRFKTSERGQGVVEYILVLCISALLVLTFVYQFSTAFRTYAQNYFGEYIACLLESGELPGQAGECQTQFKAFSIADGHTATGGTATGGVGTGSGGSGGSGGTGSGSTTNSKTKPKTASSSSSSGGTTSTSEQIGSNSPSGGDGFGSGGRSRQKTSNVGKASNLAGAGDGKAKEGLKAVGSVADSTSSDSRGGRRYNMGTGFAYNGQEDDEEREKDKPTSQPVAKSDGDHLKSKSVPVEAQRAIASKAEESSGFSLGNFIRILLIAGILIAIFILFGGQLLAITKGGEK